MAKFSVGRLEDGEGSSASRNPKRPRRGPQSQTNSEQFPEEEEEEEGTVEVADHEYQEFSFGEDEGQEREEEVQGGRANDGGNRVRADPVRSCRNPPISLTLTDPEVFDCPICYEPLTTPVFQCENGHTACSSCCSKLMNKCPSCCAPIGYNRCRAIEKVLESVRVICRNARYGCKETMGYSMKHDHEKRCPYAPCSCPLSDCNFVGTSRQLYRHFSGKHKNSAIHFTYNGVVRIALNASDRFLVLQELIDGVLFILNNITGPLGNVISVSCVAPSWKEVFFYDILARPEGGTLRFQSVTKSIQELVDNPPSMGFLLVPFDSFGSSGQLNLDLCIGRSGVSTELS